MTKGRRGRNTRLWLIVGGHSDGHPLRHGTSLLELLAVAIVLGVLAALALPRFWGPSDSIKQNACYVLKGEIEIQAQLWRRHKGNWPAADLSDIGADLTYFPDGLPSCPVDGSTYLFDPVTGRVTGHDH